MKSIASAAVILALAGLASPAMAVDPTGIWKSTTKYDDQTVECTFKLWLDSEGSILAGYCFDNPNSRGVAISPAVFNVENGKVGFSVTRDINGERVIFKYAGTMMDDIISGQSSMEKADGRQITNWVAKRQR